MVALVRFNLLFVKTNKVKFSVKECNHSRPFLLFASITLIRFSSFFFIYSFLLHPSFVSPHPFFTSILPFYSPYSSFTSFLPFLFSILLFPSIPSYVAPTFPSTPSSSSSLPSLVPLECPSAFPCFCHIFESTSFHCPPPNVSLTMQGTLN